MKNKYKGLIYAMLGLLLMFIIKQFDTDKAYFHGSIFDIMGLIFFFTSFYLFIYFLTKEDNKEKNNDEVKT